MWTLSRVRESIAADDGPETLGGLLWRAWKVGIRAIDVEEAKPFLIAHSPLKVVHQRPSCVATNVYTIKQVRWKCICVH